MADIVKFDFSKMQSLSEAFSGCLSGLSELSTVLEAEVSSAAQWWKGASYDAYEAKYSGSGKCKSTLEALYDKTKDVSGFLGKLADAKKDFERNTSTVFK